MAISLYDRLGCEDGIRRLVDDVVAAHMENPVIKARFLPYLETPDRLDESKRLTVEFFAAGSGGDVEYTGRSMPETHRGMNISEAEFMAATDDILATLKRHNIDEQTRNEVLTIVYSLKDDVMHM